ncbi:MAG: anaerobic ribonucleoside-triphosphate reductase activating protein [Deltaproteobacteria bacterium]|nr:anaerobic ribonucleoside-triphosphate reductase activating protein [Deltaproteobacteria bacterium]MBW2309570.1 anaerobic ribonucleoside-triphosphate reductase activating protein [Deltaproteobacteria bacterium]
MLIGGLQRFSLIDYPGKICAIVFTQGCNLRCPYCHNPELVETKPSGLQAVTQDEVVSFLEARRGKLDAVTITGGEPLLQSDIGAFLSSVKSLGYLVKLDTNGSFPSRLETILRANAADYIAMDIKAPLDKYEQVVRRSIDTGRILSSIKLIMDCGLAYEFRTTVVKALLGKDDFVKIGELIKGSRLYVLQRFVASKLLDDRFLDADTFSEDELNSIRCLMEGYVEQCIVR